MSCYRHGQTGSRTYRTWGSMVQRCLNPRSTNFFRYGGAGIQVCARWRDSFAAFLEDMGERPDGMTLDRIDNSKGYEPGNCRWATWIQQAANMNRARGERHGSSKLTAAIVEDIRASVRSGQTQASQGRKYGVSREAIRLIVSGRRWRHEDDASRAAPSLESEDAP